MAIETETAIHGFIASEPRLSFTQRGDARLYARVGRDRSEMSEEGSRVDLEPDFHDLIMWGRSAERASEVLAKGDRFIAQGHVVAGERVVDGRTEPTEAFVARRIGPDLNMMKVTVHRRRDAPTPAPGAPAVAEAPDRSSAPSAEQTAREAVAERQSQLPASGGTPGSARARRGSRSTKPEAATR